MTGLLKRAEEFFKARQTRIATRWEDPKGQYAFLVWVEGAEGNRTPFVVTAKKYLGKRNDVRVASFFRRKVVERAADLNGKVLLFVSQGDSHLVFDPDAVLRYGVEPDDQSERKQQGEDWVDIPADWGCSLADYIDRVDGPRTEPAADDPIHALRDPEQNDGDDQPTLGEYDD